ncbi:YolD-like family protein [Alkalicoccobacillus gibsonii]|jgi:hypothetical protein|uniref:YolD-like family protein n=1 Tax=Alkalicoccobacillus gibsonii TaxID=79881 RepID=A0ABU9VJF9_9BACI
MSDFLERGNLLWEGSRMMLPEHKQAIRAQNEREKHSPAPELDVQELEELGRVATHSLTHSTPVHIVYWENGYDYKLIATVEQVEPQKQQVTVRESKDLRKTIMFDQLKSIERI